jgi:hypothetical protein
MKTILHLAAIAALSLGSLTAGTISYSVAVNTAGLNDVAEINLELVPGIGSPLVVEAVISGFTPQGSLLAPKPGDDYLGAPVGSLDSTLTLTNGGSGDGYARSFIPGGTFQFLLTLTGAGVGAGALGTVETNFRVLLLDADLNVLLGGAVVELVVSGNGEVSVSALQGTASVSQVPEPGNWLLMGSALVLLGRRLRA